MSPFSRRLQQVTTVQIPSGTGTITHGSQITTANTGYGAFFDTSLGRNVQNSDLQVVSGNHYISDFVSTGGSLAKKHFTGSINIDVNNVTFTACLFDNPVVNYLNGVHASGTNFNWCTVSPATAGDICISHQGYSTYRCYLRGCADGLRINGGATTMNIVECYIRVRMQDPNDHNDTMQSVGGSGTVIVQRCNLSVVPEGGVLPGGSGGPDSVLLAADESSSSVSFQVTMQDNLVEGTGSFFSIRLYDGALSPNITYTVTGSKHVRPGATGNEVDRGSSNTTPTSQITWSNNTWQDDGSVIPLG